MDNIEEVKALVISSERSLPSPVSFSDMGGLLPVKEQKKILREYTKRLKNFREWLLSQLVQGVHYGFPPGCQAKYDNDGNLLLWNKSKGEYMKVPTTQWTPKASLYQAGAFFIVKLLRLKDVYHTDMDLWRMMGEPKGTICRKCELLDINGNSVAEGSGAYKVGSKGMNENATIKMADKCAVVAAVQHATGIQDLFTQDMEDVPQSSEVEEEERNDFTALVQKWVNEVAEGPLEKWEVSPQEIKELRANIRIWCANKIPKGPEAAIEWVRNHVALTTKENAEGRVLGIKFVLKNVQKRAESDELPEKATTTQPKVDTQHREDVADDAGYPDEVPPPEEDGQRRLL